MEMTTELLVYLRNIPVNFNNHTMDVSDTSLDDDFGNFSSRYEYTTSLSKGAIMYLRNTISNLVADDIYTYSLADNALSNVVQIPSLINLHQGAYSIIQSIVLETVTLTYVLDEEPDFLESYSNIDFENIRDNINFIVDWLGDYPEYRFLIQYLRDLYLAVCYSQNQIQLVIGDL